MGVKKNLEEKMICPIECVICGEVTVLNQLQDGSVVCSCPSHRKFKQINIDGSRAWVPFDQPM
jgi:hypothetical protein